MDWLNTVLTLLLAGLLIYNFIEKKKSSHKMKIRIEILQQVLKGNCNARILTSINDKESELDFTINQLIEKVQYIKVQSKRNEQKRKQLLSNISHDIRTPLTSIIGYIDAVKNQIVHGEEKDFYLHTASQKSKELKRLTDEIFELAKLDANELPLKPERFDLNELVREVFIQFIPRIQTLEMDIDVQIPEMPYWIYSDKKSVLRSVQNLIQNALQHGKDGKKIGVIIQEQEKLFSVTIWNTGKFIPREKLPYIFDRLFKTDDVRKSSSDNHGLGLTVAKSMVEKNGGTIDVESIPGGRTSFTMYMPKYS